MTTPSTSTDPQASLAEVFRLLAERGRRLRAAGVVKTGDASQEETDPPPSEPEQPASDDGR